MTFLNPTKKRVFECNARVSCARFCASIFVIVIASAVSAGDAENGLRIAQRWCSACHLVTLDQRVASADVPSFRAVAEKYVDARSLAAFLAAPYPRMPPLSLTREEVADLVSYIRTLGPKGEEPPQLQEKDKPPSQPRRG